jgi:hypothetical protein
VRGTTAPDSSKTCPLRVDVWAARVNAHARNTKITLAIATIVAISSEETLKRRDDDENFSEA